MDPSEVPQGLAGTLERLIHRILQLFGKDPIILITRETAMVFSPFHFLPEVRPHVHLNSAPTRTPTLGIGQGGLTRCFRMQCSIPLESSVSILYRPN